MTAYESRPHPLTGYLGTFIRLLGVVMLAPNMRVIPLTPMMPFATPIDDWLSRRSRLRPPFYPGSKPIYQNSFGPRGPLEITRASERLPFRHCRASTSRFLVDVTQRPNPEIYTTLRKYMSSLRNGTRTTCTIPTQNMDSVRSRLDSNGYSEDGSRWP